MSNDKKEGALKAADESNDIYRIYEIKINI